MRRKHIATSTSLALLLAASATYAIAARDPGEQCNKAAPKALAGCIGKANKAVVRCFKKTGVACVVGDKKFTAALDGIDKRINKKCLDSAAVETAGYAPLAPGGLIARYRNTCVREVETISTRSFGSSTGPILPSASDADKKCLLKAAKEAGKVLAGSIKQTGKCSPTKCDLTKTGETLAKLTSKSAIKIDKSCADLVSLLGSDSVSFVAAAAKQLSSAAASSCDPMDTTHCLFPTTNDYFSRSAPDSETSLQLSFSVEAMPANVDTVRVNPTRWNDSDGFSIGPMLVFDDQSIDLAMTGAPPITDLAASLLPDSPVVIIDAASGDQQLLWIERDHTNSVVAEQPLIIRVGKNLENGKRYIVALRNMRDSVGDVIPPGSVFASYRDEIPSGQFPIEARRPQMEEIFSILNEAGIARNDLYLAWSFTTQSAENTAKKLLHMRDDAFDNVIGAGVPTFQVDTVDEPLDANIFRRVEGTFEVPLYLDGGGVPGAALRLGPDGLPTNEGDYFTANFRCIIPYAATTGGAAPAIPARAALYGHGLLGSQSEASSSHVRDMASEHNFVICGTAWTGFADEDTGTVIQVIQDFSRFPEFIDRQHQGVLNFMVLGRLMQHANGFASDPAFQVGGQSVIDPSDLFYDGNSQGGILGGVLAAVSQDITRFVLGVPGINYSTLLNRSVDFSAFGALLNGTYTNGLDRTTLLSLAQIIWDQTDPSGHINHITANPYPDTPAKKILYHVAFGDHQVAPVTAEIAARSTGAMIHQPALSPSKVVPEVTPYYDIPAIPSYPFDGSALVIWDSGNPAPPVGNVPPMEILPADPEWADLLPCAMNHGSDPHECPRRQPEARLQKSEFLKTGGQVIDACGGAPCLAPAG